MQNFQDIEHFVKTLSAAIKKKIPTKVSQLTNDAGYKTTDTNTTYKLSKSGSTVTLTGSDGSTTSITDSNTTYSSLKNPYSLTIQNNGTTVASYDGSTAKTANFTNATTSANGLMSKSDKAKLDGIGAGANVKSVNGKTGVVNLSKADVGLGNVDNTSDADKHVYANNLKWGGVNIANDISPLDVATSNLFAGNIMAYSKPAGITVEYSTDGGTTWADYGADDKSKIRLVTPEAGGANYYLGKKNTAQVATMDLLRIELDARKMGIYCNPKNLLINISTGGGTGSYVNIEYSTRASDTVFHNFGKYDISGWSGWNSIPINNIPSRAFGTNGHDDQTVILRLTFGFTGFSKGWETKTSFSVWTMSMIASKRWAAPSQMAWTNSLYRLDENQNAIFPAKVTATSFAGATATSSADGLMSKTDKAKLDGIGAGSNVKSVNGKTGAVTLAKSDVGLSNVDNTADSAKSVKYAASAGSAGSADTVDGFHEYSFLRYRDNARTNGTETLWNQIGIREYDDALPSGLSGLSGLYSYGAVVSLPSGNARFDLYYNHPASANGNGLYYRTGWGTDKKRWVHLIDSQSIGSQSVNYANSAGSVAWGNVSGKPSTYPPSSHTHTKAQVGLGNVANLDQSKAIKSITRNGTTFTATALDGTTTTFTQQDNNTTYGLASQSSNGLMSAADKKAVDREFFRMLPKGGTVIPNGANLNSTAYIKVGNYYQSAIANTTNMTNIPVKTAFMMYVLSPLSETYDNESTAKLVYRLRIFVEYNGNGIHVQMVSSGETAGSFDYGPWVKMTNSNDLSAVSNTINTHIADKSNPHGVTKAQVGLGNVDNTADSAKSVKYAASAGSANSVAWGNVSDKPSSLPANGGNSSTVNGHTVNADVPSGAKFTDTIYSAATQSANGLMSAADKKKLDGIGTGSNVKSVNGKTGAVTLAKSDIGLGNVANLDQSKAIKSITRSGTTFTATALDGTKTTFTQQDTNTTYGIATSSADGLMSKTDKAKLDGISSGADVVTIKTVKVNGTALTPDSNKAVNVPVPKLANNATTTASGMALDARMGKTLSDQIASVKTGAIDQIVNLTAAGWTGDTAPYSQTVNVTGMTEDLLCELFSACPKSATVAEREAYNEAFALVASGYAETADGSATFLVDEKPAIDIGVRIFSLHC